MDIMVDKSFKDSWTDVISGDGVLTVTNNIVKATGTTNSNAKKEFVFPVQPGEKVTISVVARSLNGTEGRMVIDNHDAAGAYVTSLDYLEIKSIDWQLYQVTVTIPYQSSRPYLKIALGKFSSVLESVDMEFHSINIQTENGYGSPILKAMGMVRLLAGVPSVHPTFKNFGIKEVTFNGTDTVTVKLKDPLYSNMRAVVLVSGTGDSLLIPQGGTVVAGETPTFNIQWTNGTARANVSSANLYVNCMVYE
jgi:hypothetical protein